MINVYGRQWFSPAGSHAFDPLLIAADEYILKGELDKGLDILKQLRQNSKPAFRRLKIAKNQASKFKYNISSKIAVGFVDWYQGFLPSSNFILDLFCRAGIDVQNTEVREADLIVCGCYGNLIATDRDLFDDKLVLFVSGENLFPSFEFHDFSLTTYPNSFCGKNIRLPQWIGEVQKSGSNLHLSGYKNINKSKHKDILFSAIYNNTTPLREEIISILRGKYGEDNVKVFGSQRYGHVDKFEILSRSVFNICLENSIGDGYVTEKLLHALAFNCYAVYWGDPGFRDDFKDANVYNIFENSSYVSMLSWCDKIVSKSTDLQVDNILNIQDIFSQPPSEIDITNHLYKWSKYILNWRNQPFL